MRCFIPDLFRKEKEREGALAIPSLFLYAIIS